MDYLSVVGARPQFVKLAAICKHMGRNRHIIVNSGQHYDFNMAEIFFNQLKIPKPDYSLGVGSGTHAVQTAAIMEKLEPIIKETKPEFVLVYGDTNTTLAAALTSAKLGYPVAHIEAGCRSYEPFMPEEINRTLTDHVSSLMFCSTDTCVGNLVREGRYRNIFRTGDVMVDILNEIQNISPPSRYSNDYALATIHRADNTDKRRNLKNIIHGLGGYHGPVIFPIHPRTQKMINEFDIDIPKNVDLIEPADYITMIQLIKGANVIVTDSGGVQKEAFILNKKCFTVRNATEWPETLLLGWNTLITPACVKPSLSEPFIKPTTITDEIDAHPFGCGHAGEEIVHILEGARL